LNARKTAQKIRRRQFLHLAAGAAASPSLLVLAWAEDYPARPVHIVVGFPPGSGPDIVARLLGQRLAERFGQQFVVDNRPGAGSNIGTETVVRSPADGYTLLFAAASNAINATLYANLTFDFVRDIAPVASVASTPFVMVINPALPAKTIPEFVAYAKANAGKVNMASPGNGTAPHLCGELFAMMTGVNLVHVPYRSNYMADLLGGQVQMAFSTATQIVDYINAGKLRALGVTSAMRLEALPDVPAIGELVPGYDAAGWFGVAAPKDTLPAIVEKLNAAINGAVAEPDMKARLVSLGVVPLSMTSAAFTKFIAGQTEKWGKVIKFADIKPE
jgi:tripartite-type tricarboxylate transporter receptor subunit TctC